MAIKITSIQEAIGDTGIKILVHGPAGAGKTVLCATTGDSSLMVSAEAGLLSIKDAPARMGVTVVKSIADLAEVLEFLMQGNHGLETIHLDSVSEIAEVCLSEEKANNKDPRASYGNLFDEVMKMLRAFRDLPGLNVVMTCKQARQVDESTGLVTFVPSLPGRQLTQNISYLFDEVFALRVMKHPETGEDVRVLQTNRDIQYEAKDRSGMLEMFERANLRHIFDTIHGNTPSVAEEVAPEPEAEEVEEITETETETETEEGN